MTKREVNVCFWVDTEFLEAMDRHIKEKDYAGRSHFLRTLVKRELSRSVPT